MADLEQFRAELRRLAGETNHTIVPVDATGQIEAVYHQNAISAAIVDGKRRVTEVIAKGDDGLAVSLPAGVLQTKALIEKDAQEYTSPGVQEIAKPVVEAFSQQKFAHNLAYYQAFGDQAMKELRREIVVPPPKRRRRFFANE